MKHLHLAIALVALLLTASCTKNEEIKSVTTSTRTLVTLATALNGSDATTAVSTGTFRFETDNVKKQMDILMDLSSTPSISQSKFYVKGLTTSYPATNVVEFTADQLTPTDESGKAISGYSISSLKGVIDESRNVAHITFQLRTSSASYQIVLTTMKIMSALPDKSVDYSSATTAYCEFRLNTKKLDSISATIYMHNVKFADNMPTQTKIGIPNVKVTPQANGFKLSADSVIPNSYDGQDNATPMDSRKVTDLKADLNLVSGNYTLEFNCFGIKYNVAQDLNKMLTTLRVKN